MESAAVAQARAAVDLAILGVLADGGLRRSEAAALTWPDGTARLTVQKGKNQPEPATVALTEAPARALRDLQPDDADPATPVFGLTGEALANRVRAAARAAGLGEQIVTNKTLRRRFFALAGRLTRPARRLTLHLPRRWPWEEQFSRALARLQAIPLPA